MTRDQQEMALWAAEYSASRLICATDRAADADAAVEQFRKRYPVEPIAPDQADNAAATTLITLLDDIAGDSAFSGFGQSMQSRIYAAVESLRKGQPVALAPDWYDEPPFAKDGESYPCWVAGEEYPCATHWSHYDLSPRWVYSHTEDDRLLPLAGRRVCPITKPQEPPQ